MGQKQRQELDRSLRYSQGTELGTCSPDNEFLALQVKVYDRLAKAFCWYARVTHITRLSVSTRTQDFQFSPASYRV